jgi:hypothetical protein
VHLNVIKVPNNATTTMTITSLTLYKSTTSGITDVSSDATYGNGKVYNLNGQQITTYGLDASKTLHGLYIVNGKKILFK